MENELITMNSSTVYQIDVEMIYVDPDHPFLLHEDSEEYLDIKESISEIGIITPLLLLDDGSDNSSYRLICGKRRLHIAKSLGYQTVPCIVIAEADDYTINRYRNASNFQTRQFILPSEKAHAYKMELDAFKRLPGRPLKNGDPAGPNFGIKSTELLSDQVGESATQIKRYVRLNKLIPPLMQMVDDGRLSLRTAGDYAYKLTQDNQKIVAKSVGGSKDTVVQSQIIAVLKEQEHAKKEGRTVSEEAVTEALKDPKPKEKVTKDLVIPGKIVEELFSGLRLSQDKKFQIDYIIEACKFYRKQSMNEGD